MEPAAALDDARRALGLYQALGEQSGTFRSWQALSYAFMQLGRHEEGVAALEEALALRDPRWPTWTLAMFDNIAGIVYAQAGDTAKAREHLLALHAVCSTAGPVDDLNARSLLVDLDVADGRIDEAAEAAFALLRRPETLVVRWTDGRGLRTLATALMLGGRLDDAERVYRTALIQVRRHYGNGAGVLLDAATWVARKGRLEDAARVCAYADAVHERDSRTPRLVTRRLREQLRAELAARLPAARLALLELEGRALSDDAAGMLAFPIQPAELAAPSRPASV